VDKDPTSNGARPDADGASTLDLSGRCVGSSYILIRPVGQGATGTVWRGIDRASGEPVAVKLLHASLLRQPKLVTRFVQERTILMMLQHRNVVRVRDLFSVGESLALVMDLVAGGSLRDYLRERHTVPAGTAAELAGQVAAALAEAHELGIVHRDLKPDNILLQSVSDRLEVRLTDFGIARVLTTPSLTTPNAVVGTPHYMSPEAFQGAAASPAADIYALGVLLYELVSGRPPYSSDNVAALMQRHLEGGAERRPGIPDPLWEVIQSCMALKPRLRPTAAELVVQLGEVARVAADTAALPPPEPEPHVRPAHPEPEPDRHPSALVPPPRPPQRRNQVPSWRWARPGLTVALVAGAMLASGVATTAWHVARSGAEPRQAEAAATSPGAIAASAPITPVIRTSAAVPRTAGTTRRVRASAAVESPAARRTAAPQAVPARTAVPEAKAYGPWQCRETLQLGSVPVLASPCHTVGGSVQVRAALAAPGGGSAALSVSVQDASSGRTAFGPSRCSGLVFADRTVTRDCGPVVARLPHGRTYVVAMTWVYEKDGRSVSGSARGNPFDW
jgi:serine/threonine protein kinase